MTTFLLTALGAVLVIEGLVYTLAPSLIDKILEALRDIPLPTRRLVGALMVVVGCILLRLAF